VASNIIVHTTVCNSTVGKIFYPWIRGPSM